MKHLNFLQKLAIKWRSAYDRDGFYYEILKELNVYIRVSIYLIFFTFFGSFLVLISGLTNEWLHAHTSGLAVILSLISRIIYFSIFIGVVSILSYESIFGIDVKSIIAAKIEKEKKIKKKKKQWWRLRNMHFVFRFLFYISVYYTLVSLLIFMVNLSFFQVYPDPSGSQINNLTAEFKNILSYFSMGYLAICLLLEYLMKRIKKC